MSPSLSHLVSLVERVFRSRTAARTRRVAGLALVIGAGMTLAITAGYNIPNLAPYTNESGIARTYNINGAIDLSGPFFQSLGTNDRSCGSCHQPSEGWSVTPAGIRARFDATGGLDPIFRTVDGADCPSADVSTLDARRNAYSMLLTKGLIRVSIAVPKNANFTVTDINDPHTCDKTTTDGLALFRRPLPACNLPFLTTVMWDGRESFANKSLEFNLAHQAMDATLGHAEGAQSPTDAQLAQIVAFELANFNTQSSDNTAQDLNTKGATGGPVPLSQQQFYVGINDPLGGNPTNAPFNPVVFTLFDKWAGLRQNDSTSSARIAVARGQALFNTRQFTISGVGGLNDLAGVPAALTGTCTTCHDTPNVGNHSVPLPINIGVSNYPALPALNTDGLPVYTIQCNNGASAPLGHPSTFQTTDPGRALITGKCEDAGKMKGPILRGLAARAPYFHNGSAGTLRAVVDFYDQRFGIGLTEQEKSDLVAFLRAL